MKKRISEKTIKDMAEEIGAEVFVDRTAIPSEARVSMNGMRLVTFKGSNKNRQAYEWLWSFGYNNFRKI